jgi:hypothetical protein
VNKKDILYFGISLGMFRSRGTSRIQMLNKVAKRPIRRVVFSEVVRKTVME